LYGYTLNVKFSECDSTEATSTDKHYDKSLYSDTLESLRLNICTGTYMYTYKLVMISFEINRI